MNRHYKFFKYHTHVTKKIMHVIWQLIFQSVIGLPLNVATPVRSCNCVMYAAIKWNMVYGCFF